MLGKEGNLAPRVYHFGHSLPRRFRIDQGHDFYTQFLNEKNRKERDAGIALGLDFMRVCDEVLVFRGNGVSAGMEREIAHAERLSLPITYVGDEYL
uniref:DUF7768 domain-containing protein n=1 Tax=Candidatus Kentrum sp. LFY TaxID=2126342 RepID=A0A450UEC2_9GAMM|nr:MAG: hypothetical protein BECKLFY1418A_GA0070994_101344 [Candidatus Kentron sp. LFY]